MLQFLAIANLVAAIQSLLLAIHFLIKKRGTRLLNLLMSLLSFCLMLIIFNTYVSLSEIQIATSLIQKLANNGMWFIGPALFAYVNYGLKDIRKSFFLIHFLPYIIPLIIDLFFNWSGYDAVIPFVGFTQIGIYLGLSINVCIRRYKERKAFYSWVLPAMTVFLVLVLMNFTFTLLNQLNLLEFSFKLLQGLTVILFIPIYYITYKEMNADGNFGIKQKKYRSTPLDSEKLHDYLRTIEEALDGRELFRNQDLTLAKLSIETGIPSKYISQVVNQVRQMSFSEYLTQYRIDEAKRNLDDPSKHYLSIAGISEESGFASTSRFNFLFKQHTGMTPSEYQKRSE